MHIMMGGEKSIGKALQLVGFLSNLDSRTDQTQVVNLGEKLDVHSPPLIVDYESVTDRLTH